MTSKVPEAGLTEYLDLPFGRFSFLLERKYCCATLFDGPQFGEDDTPQGSALVYRGHEVPLIRLDRWLTQTFQLPPCDGFPCVVVTSTAVLSSQTLELWGPTNRPSYIGWSVGREPRLVRLGPEARGSFPQSLASFLVNCGVTGCGFPQPGSLSFYLDPEVLIRGTLRRGP